MGLLGREDGDETGKLRRTQGRKQANTASSCIYQSPPITHRPCHVALASAPVVADEDTQPGLPLRRLPGGSGRHAPAHRFPSPAPSRSRHGYASSGCATRPCGHSGMQSGTRTYSLATTSRTSAVSMRRYRTQRWRQRRWRRRQNLRCCCEWTQSAARSVADRRAAAQRFLRRERGRRRGIWLRSGAPTAAACR